MICPDAALEALGDWPGLPTVLAAESIRSINGSAKVEPEIRYFLSSSSGDPQGLVQTSRRHGSIEDRLHGVLEVTFREDNSRARDPTAARNLALLRKIALNRVSQDRSTNSSRRAKRKKAAWNDDAIQPILWG